MSLLWSTYHPLNTLCPTHLICYPISSLFHRISTLFHGQQGFLDGHALGTHSQAFRASYQRAIPVINEIVIRDKLPTMSTRPDVSVPFHMGLFGLISPLNTPHTLINGPEFPYDTSKMANQSGEEWENGLHNEYLAVHKCWCCHRPGEGSCNLVPTISYFFTYLMKFPTA